MILQELDWATAVPHAKDVEAPRRECSHFLVCLQVLFSFFLCAAHVDDAPPWFGPNAYRVISVGMLILLALAVVGIVGGVAFMQAQSKRKKHFF